MTSITLEYAIVEFMTSNLLLFILLLLCSFLFWKKKKELRKLWLSLFGSGVLTLILKFLVQRQRPLVQEYFFANIPDYSFPSLQTTLAFATIPFCWKASPKYKYLFLLFAGIIAVSRIYLQKHYLSDVVGGALIGLCMGYLIMKKIK